MLPCNCLEWNEEVCSCGSHFDITIRIGIKKVDAVVSAATVAVTGSAEDSYQRSRYAELDLGAMVSQECVV